MPSIAVLIPNYDWDVTNLITSLHQQLSDVNADFEIRCFDDAQTSVHQPANNKLNDIENVHYRINENSLGRAANRNALASSTSKEVLLFLDGDSGLENNPNFISDYLKNYQPNTVVCGGTAYGERPTNNDYLLRYTYGIQREQLLATTRQVQPWRGFSAFNFLIEKKLFDQFGFDESLSEYGHEDTLFGNELKYRCIAVKHIDNPALHLGLDSNETFLEKTRKAVENLRDLINKGLIDEDVKLYAWYAKIRKAMMTAVMGALYVRFKNKWEKNLCSNSPNLRTLDLYKLCYLCTLPILHKRPPEKKMKI